MQQPKSYRASYLLWVLLFLGNFNYKVLALSLPLRVAVIVPGYLMTGSDMEGMCQTLYDLHGILSVPVPIQAHEWMPCVGGRSIAPILERVDCTVKYALSLAKKEAKGKTSLNQIDPDLWDYRMSDLLQDMLTNPGGFMRVGGAGEVDDYPEVRPQGRFHIQAESELIVSENGHSEHKIALVGHSAGGWICRAYLSQRPYSGMVYDGARYVDRLVTLGTPHKGISGPAHASVRWVQEEPAQVESLCVGSSGFDYDDENMGEFTRASYLFCGYGSGSTGDGVTPIDSAFEFEGADKLELTDVHHLAWDENLLGFVAKELASDFSSCGGNWYGSDEVVEEWAEFLKN